MPKQKPELPVKEYEISSKYQTATIYEQTEDKARLLFYQMYPDHQILNLVERKIGFQAVIF